MRSMGEGHPPVVAISRSCPVETLRQYNLAQRREDKKKVLARPVMVQSCFGDDAIVTGIPLSPCGSLSWSGVECPRHSTEDAGGIFDLPIAN